MKKKTLDPLKDAHYPLNKPEVVANAVSEEIDDKCVNKLNEDLPEKIYHSFKDIKQNLPQDNTLPEDK